MAVSIDVCLCVGLVLITDGCLAHKTAVALCALSQYIRFIVTSVSLADQHLLSVNYLVEPYRLPQKNALAVISTVHSVSQVGNTSHVGNTSDHEVQHLSVIVKGSDNHPVTGRVGYTSNAVTDIAEVKKLSSDVKIVLKESKSIREFARGEPEGGYDENTEVELDKDDVRLILSRDSDVKEDIAGGLLHSVSSHSELLAAAAAGWKRSRGDASTVRVPITSHWFLPVIAVFLLTLWFRCVRCLRCGFLLRRCRWT